MTVKVPKDYRPWIAAAVDAGWTLSNGGKHLKLTAPDGYSTPIPGTSRNRGGLFVAFTLRLRQRGVTPGAGR